MALDSSIQEGCGMVYNYTASNGRIIGESQMGRDLQGSDCSIIAVLFGNLLGGTEKNLRQNNRDSIQVPPEYTYRYTSQLFNDAVSC